MAQNPRMYILLTFVFILAMMAGFLCFRQERNPLELWIPGDSTFYTDTNWLMGEYGEGLRLQTVLITAPDVLQPNIMQQVKPPNLSCSFKGQCRLILIILNWFNLSDRPLTWNHVK